MLNIFNYKEAINSDFSRDWDSILKNKFKIKFYEKDNIFMDFVKITSTHTKLL